MDTIYVVRISEGESYLYPRFSLFILLTSGPGHSLPLNLLATAPGSSPHIQPEQTVQSNSVCSKILQLNIKVNWLMWIEGEYLTISRVNFSANRLNECPGRQWDTLAVYHLLPQGPAACMKGTL